ncbi:MAG: efflux RND transporter periplasmic adaptor subunit [Deltaproteobacteria bacterium]|nr:efflux RND transporter periplasmic adaptor subunit [Deltaproteobacteria bacterium]
MARRLVMALVGLAAVGGLGAFIHSRGEAQAPGANGGAPSPAERVTPVRTANVQVGDVPIVLEGLGSAAAYETVTVRSQVDGRLEKVSFTEGQAVKKGDLLAQVDPRPFTIQLHQAQAALARDQATLSNAELNLKRDQDLVDKKLISPQDFDNQKAATDSAKAALQADQAAIESANLNLDYARITSPIDGLTGVRQVDMGNLVHASDPNGIVVVTKLDPIAVLFTLPQDDLPQVSAAMAQGTLTVELFSRDGSAKLGEGKLLLVDNQINASTATLKLKAIADNPGHTLWPNQFVKARLKLEVQHDAKTVPAEALQTGPNGMFVYTVSADQTVAATPVKVSLVQGDTAVISSGLSGGEQVVIDGQNQLRPGAKVSTKSMGAGGPRGEATASAGESSGGGHHRGDKGGGGGGGSGAAGRAVSDR